MNACIITIGNELLNGTRLDTNSHWIAKKIINHGVDVGKMVSIGDKDSDICNAIEDSVGKYDFVFITGGLGPTHDDITVASFEKVFKLSPIVDNNYMMTIKQKFIDRNLSMPKINQNQAIILEGTHIIDNELGTARGIYYKKSKTNFFVMPGVPAEMYNMMDTIIIPKYIGAQVELKYKTIRTSGIAESKLSEKIKDLMSSYSKDFKFAFLPSYKGVDFILKAANSNVRLNKVAEEFYNAMLPYSFGYDKDSFLEFIINKLNQKNITISLAESCTGGFLGKLFTDIPGSSAVFKGGVIAYCNSIKVKQLNVSKNILEKYGAVSSEVAIEMAQNIKKIFNSDIGISLTGISGPESESTDKKVGLVHIAIAFKNQCISKQFNFNLNRDLNRKLSCYTALNIIRKKIEE